MLNGEAAPGSTMYTGTKHKNQRHCTSSIASCSCSFQTSSRTPSVITTSSHVRLEMKIDFTTYYACTTDN